MLKDHVVGNYVGIILGGHGGARVTEEFLGNIQAFRVRHVAPEQLPKLMQRVVSRPPDLP